MDGSGMDSHSSSWLRWGATVGGLGLLMLFVMLSPAPIRAAGPFDYHPVTPCRVIDTRQTSSQTNGQPLVSPGPYAFRVQGFCNIPNGAAAVTLNATVVSPSGLGDLRLFPVGAGAPLVSTLNYPGGIGALANGATVPLAAVRQVTDKDLDVLIGATQSITVHLLLDVTGYFQ
ncbi:MAG: hypothetical protein M3O15_08615 [Acidobacteriota bacterium]|nr:hypothetical protein [Acidobacteriota bacterium]